MITKIKAMDFFKAWCETMEDYGKDLLTVKRWYNTPSLKTQLIEGIIYKKLAEKLRYEYCSSYYHTDAVFYLEQDLVPKPIMPENACYLRKIRIAIEHENDFSSGLFGELSHLMILDCDLRVLITYFNNYFDEKENEMGKLLDVINGEDANKFSDNESILLINAARKDEDNKIVKIFWEGFIFKNGKWDSFKERPLFGVLAA